MRNKNKDAIYFKEVMLYKSPIHIIGLERIIKEIIQSGL